MKNIPAIIVAPLALAAVPATLVAQDAPKAAIGIAIQAENNKLKIAEVMPGSTGALMGIRAGDVLTHAGGKKLNSQTKFTAYMRSVKVGDPVTLTVKRGSENLELTGKAMPRPW